MKRIYLDYASLTPIDKGVLKIMKKYSKGDYTNPSSLYASGVAARKALEEAKVDIAKILHAHPDEIVFTSGGTESNDVVFRKFSGKKILVSAIEHSTIIKYESTIKIPVDQKGIVDLDFLKKNLTADTALVSIMMVNNEIGTIEPIIDIAKIIRDFNKQHNCRIIFHTDASQAIYEDLFVERLGIDLVTLDGHKMYGPRGIGMLYVKRGSVEIERNGTENIPAIKGFAYALEKMSEGREKIADLKNFYIKGLREVHKEIKINGSVEYSSPHILNISIPNIDSEFFVLQLDAKGIEVSTKSACLRDEDESYVLKAIGASSRNSVRFSFGRGMSKGDLKKALSIIKNILSK